MRWCTPAQGSGSGKCARIQFPAEGPAAFSVAASPLTPLIVMKIRALNNPDYNPVCSDLLGQMSSCFFGSIHFYFILIFSKATCVPFPRERRLTAEGKNNKTQKSERVLQRAENGLREDRRGERGPGAFRHRISRRK